MPAAGNGGRAGVGWVLHRVSLEAVYEAATPACNQSRLQQPVSEAAQALPQLLHRVLPRRGRGEQ